MEIKFNHTYKTIIKDDEDNSDVRYGIGIGDYCNVEGDYIAICYEGEAKLVRLENLKENSLEGKIVDWGLVDEPKACKDFCEHLLRKQKLWVEEAA